MGTITGPGVFWWDTFNTLFDPSSPLSYSGSGFTFDNPIKYKGWTDWTMTDNTNLISGSGISKYVKQITKQQFSQRLVQVANSGSDKYTFIMIYRQPTAAAYSNIVQWNSNNLVYAGLNNGEIEMKHHNVSFITSGLAMTDDRWRHYVFTRSGTAATMYVNGSLFTTFTGLSGNVTNATDTKVFDYEGCDGAIGQFWFNMGLAITAAQVSQHYRAFRGRFGIR
jgi:hypothetical protein